MSVIATAKPVSITALRRIKMNTAPSLFPEDEIQTRPEQRLRRLEVVRVTLVKDRSVIYEANKLIRPAECAEAFRALVGEVDREYFVAFMLDGKNRIMSANVVAIGSLNQAIVHPREVFKPAILANAACVVLAHNHPSGDPAPSREDREITRRLKEGGELLSIKVLDHIIIGDNSYFSFIESGLL